MFKSSCSKWDNSTTSSIYFNKKLFCFCCSKWICFFKQLFKTVGRGWGVRTLHDLPLGTFISVYSGEIFTSEQADERGKLIGDEYQADLDFFEVNISVRKI